MSGAEPLTAGVGDAPDSHRPVLLFDGDCGFCTASAQWIARRWPDRGPVAIPWQEFDRSLLADAGLGPAEASSAAWWIDAAGNTWRGHLAIAHALVATEDRWPWGLAGSAISVPPLRWMAALVYPVVARLRGWLPGSTPACEVRPSGERKPQ